MNKTTTFLFVTIAALVSGCTIYEAPSGPRVVEVVPVTYVWDGVEYVGEYNGRFYYYGPAGAWVVCDPVVWDRFHHWEGYHSDWRLHAIHNDGNYRLDRAHHEARFGGTAPGPRPAAAPRKPAVAAPRPAAPPPRPAAATPRQAIERPKPGAPTRATPSQKKQEEDKKEKDNKDNR